jgi:hypothetical protein
VTLLRELKDNKPWRLVYIFTCISDPVNHTPHTRPRQHTSEGTSNLQNGITKCFGRTGRVRTKGQCPPKKVTIPYSEATHRALIALRCAKSHRPFNMVLDAEYAQEVEMLQPGTMIPHPITVSRDIRSIYIEMLKHVREFFGVSCCHFT